MKNRSSPNALFPAAAMFGLMLTTGCAASMQVNHATDPAMKPSAYQTYALLEHDLGDQTANVAIEGTIHEAMQKRGYQHVINGDSDLLINFKVLTVGAQNAPNPGMITGGGGNLGTVGPDLGIEDVMATAQGSVDKLVLIQLHDAKSMRVVWVGWAQAEVAKEQLRTQAANAATEILQRIPTRI